MTPDYPAMTRRCRLTVEYDGSAYHGWQVQANAPSVQAVLEIAASHLAGTPVRVRGAGRTDAGVHARGQTAVARLPAAIPPEKIPEAMNSRLPGCVVVTAAREADEAFDPRRDCVLKQYSYSMSLGPVRQALWDRRAWHVKRPLDIELMREEASLFTGTHDFTSFCNRELAGKDNTRTVERCECVVIPPDGAGRQRLVFYVEGKSFLYNQVRAMVGTLFGVGTGRFPPGSVAAIFAARNREAAGESAPAGGLCLEWVLYPGERRPVDGCGLFL